MASNYYVVLEVCCGSYYFACYDVNWSLGVASVPGPLLPRRAPVLGRNKSTVKYKI